MSSGIQPGGAAPELFDLQLLALQILDVDVGYLELASRLSFFLWSSIPDDTLLDAAAKGALKNEQELARPGARIIGTDNDCDGRTDLVVISDQVVLGDRLVPVGIAVTGEKIDRSNPLNIGMAVLSAVPIGFAAHGALAALLGMEPSTVRVICPWVGGGFGQKTNLYPEDGIVAYAATKLNRKVRWRGDRTDEFEIGRAHV